VPFHAGFHPPATNMADSPLQAYNENLSDSDSDPMVQYMLFSQNSVFAANSLVLAQLSIAKSAVKSYFMPAVALDNAYFLAPSVKFSKLDVYELFGEAMGFLYNRKKQKRQSYSPSELSVHSDLSVPSALPTIIGKKRKVSSSVKAIEAPSCTSQVKEY
jgi:hypothetical protein